MREAGILIFADLVDYDELRITSVCELLIMKIFRKCANDCARIFL